MGDDELNFTEEEARNWGDDPRNQPQRDGVTLGFVSLCLPLLMVLVGFILASISSPSRSESEAGHGPPTGVEAVQPR